MAGCELRRSQRLGTPDSNGRDYLSSKLGWTRSTFEEWLYSVTVRPHLQEWYSLCITANTRFNDAVDWINIGEKGYFYNEHNLEDDLLLMCLCAGDDGKIQACAVDNSIDFASAKPSSHCWTTQELWARTAWRITQANRATGQIFHFAMQDRPAAAYGLVVEMLCITFHSVAHRGVGSVYLPLLKDGASDKSTDIHQAIRTGAVDFDTPFQPTDETETSTVDRASDTTFSAPRRANPASERSTIILPGNEETKVDDMGSTIAVARQLPSAEGSDTATSSDTDGTRSASTEGGGTPDTRLSALQQDWGRRVPGEDDGKAERVRMWLAGMR